MLLQSTPIRLLQTRFAQYPTAGVPIDYNNAVEIDKRSSKKHFDIRDKDVAPRLFLPSGLDNALYKSLNEQVEKTRRAQRYKKQIET